MARPEVAWWAERLQKSPAIARALVCAAVRETFEESGTLLAGHLDGTIVGDTAPTKMSVTSWKITS